MTKKIIIFTLLFSLSFQTFAWGPTGHRVVGKIADSYLSRKAKKNIEKILGNESIAMSSTWADFIKADSTYKYLNNWHYINVKAGLNLTEFTNYLNNDTGTDANTKLNFLIGELKKKETSLEQKRFYLRLLIHIEGDIHQPMHVSRAEDLGGNSINLTWLNESTNLHALWDEKLLNFQILSYTEFAESINYTTEQQRRDWQLQPISEWFFESYQLADKIYAGIKPEQKLNYRDANEYNYANIEIIKQQLLKGGVRLAGLLNEIFG